MSSRRPITTYKSAAAKRRNPSLQSDIIDKPESNSSFYDVFGGRKRRKIEIEAVEPPLSFRPNANEPKDGVRRMSSPQTSGSKEKLSLCQRDGTGHTAGLDEESLTGRPKRATEKKDVTTESRERDTVIHVDELSADSSHATPRKSSRSSTPSHRKAPAVTYLSRTPSSSGSMPSSSPSKRPLARTSTAPAGATTSRSFSPSTSPRKAAKDLSELFHSVNSTAATGVELPTSCHSPVKPLGVAKRMLGRSRTESSINDSTSPQSKSIEAFAIISPGATSLSASRQDTSASTSTSNCFPKPLARTTSTFTPAKTSTTPDQTSPSSTSSSPSSPSRSATRPTLSRTYAGSSRSFLVALPAPELSSLHRLQSDPEADVDPDDIDLHESYTELRAKFGVDVSDDVLPASISLQKTQSQSGTPSPSKNNGKSRRDDADDEAGGTGPTAYNYNDLKSITDLRSKGESRRFTDEVSYLFEGMDPRSVLAVQRSSALEIVSKLCDKEFLIRAKRSDFFKRAWGVSRSCAANGDKILNAILAFFAAFLTQEAPSLAEFPETDKKEFVGQVTNMLEASQRDPDVFTLVVDGTSDAALRKAGVGRVEKTLLARLNRLILDESHLFEPETSISIRLLLSTALSSLSPSLLQRTSISSVCQSLSRELLLFRTQIEENPSLSSSMQQPSWGHVSNCLDLLDSFLLGRWSGDGDNLHLNTVISDVQNKLAPGLAAMFAVANDAYNEDSGQSYAKVRECSQSALRVLINLTHESHDWCRVLLGDELTLSALFRSIVRLQQQLSSTSTVKKEAWDEDDTSSDDLGLVSDLDQLCLILALLTNLAQADVRARELVRNIKVDPSCTGGRACIRSCCCRRAVDGIRCLAQFYLREQHQASLKKPEFGVKLLKGHVAVLLGLLLQDSTENQTILLNTLPGDSNWHKLDSLVTDCREIVALHSSLEQARTSDDIEGTSHAARQILSALQTLRDANAC